MDSSSKLYELVAHRGYPSRYPENTRLGFEKAIEAGALRIEADVQLSADEIPVIFHDQTLSRLCGHNGAVHRCTKAQLDRLSPFEPSRFGNRFKGVRLMDLQDMVDLLLRNSKVILYLEIKRIALNAFGVNRVLDKILSIIEPVKNRVVIISFSIYALKAAKQRGYQRLGPVLSRWVEISHPSVVKMEPEVLFFNHKRLPFGAQYNNPLVDLAFYETSDSNVAENLAKKGARLIETDAIGEMIRGEPSE